MRKSIKKKQAKKKKDRSGRKKEKLKAGLKKVKERLCEVIMIMGEAYMEKSRDLMIEDRTKIFQEARAHNRSLWEERDSQS